MDCTQYKARYPAFSKLPLSREVWNTPEYEAWAEHFHDCTACGDWTSGQRVRARGHDPDAFPCVHIAENVTRTCDTHSDPTTCPDIVIARWPRFDEYVITKLGADYTIEHCPWCGVRLPESKRDRYFKALEALGLDPREDDVPEEYRTDAWYAQH